MIISYCAAYSYPAYPLHGKITGARHFVSDLLLTPNTGIKIKVIGNAYSKLEVLEVFLDMLKVLESSEHFRLKKILKIRNRHEYL